MCILDFLYCIVLLYLSVHVTCSMYLLVLWNTVHCIVAVRDFSFLVTSDVRSPSLQDPIDLHASMRLTSWSLLLVVVLFLSVALCSSKL